MGIFEYAIVKLPLFSFIHEEKENFVLIGDTFTLMYQPPPHFYSCMIGNYSQSNRIDFSR